MNTNELFPHTFEGVLNLVQYLRGPKGCPWDKIQDHTSIKEHLLEECYELIEAIELEKPESIAEEIGDLLLNILMHMSIAENSHSFTPTHVYRTLIEKLIRRHPHVFEDPRLSDSEEVENSWQQIKSRENPKSSILSGIPNTMPSLAFAQEAQSRASVTKFDWEDINGVLSKIVEEVHELVGAENKSEQISEFGDLLFSLVNLARWLDIEAESSLRHANKRFTLRFESMEALCREKGVDFFGLLNAEKDNLWQIAKSKTSC